MIYNILMPKKQAPEPIHQDQTFRDEKKPPKISALSIVALILAFLLPPVGLVLGIAALVLHKKHEQESGKGLAIGAIVVSVVMMILITPIIFAVAYFGLFNPTADIPDSCRGTGSLLCQEATASTGDRNLHALIINNAGDEIEVHKVYFEAWQNSDIQDASCYYNSTTGPIVNQGATFNITCVLVERLIVGSYSGDIIIEYTKYRNAPTSALIRVYQKI